MLYVTLSLTYRIIHIKLFYTFLLDLTSPHEYQIENERDRQLNAWSELTFAAIGEAVGKLLEEIVGRVLGAHNPLTHRKGLPWKMELKERMSVTHR